MTTIELGHGRGAGGGVVGWLIADEPVVATACVDAADLIGAAMMVPKAHRDPESETLLTFAFASLGGALASGAVGSADLSLLLCPVYSCLINGAIALLIHHRRAVLACAMPPPAYRSVGARPRTSRDEQERQVMRTPTPIARRPSILPGRLACAVRRALGVAIGWRAAPTSASVTTTNHIWRYLRFPASANAHLRGCTVRTIVTGPGTYRWRIFSAHCAHADQTQWQERRLHLRHAQYEWHDCWAIEGERWMHHSELHNRSHGGCAHLLGDEINGSFGDGSYHIGSTLDNVRRFDELR